MISKEMFSLKGRMRRKHFAIAWIATFLLIAVLAFVCPASYIDALAFLRVLIIAALIPAMARRLHDMGYSGWLVIGVIICPLVLLLLLVMPGMPGDNAYGPSPKQRMA